MSQPDIPSELVAKFRRRQAAVFLGAGVSVAAGMPTWTELVGRMAQDLRIDFGSEKNPPARLLAAIPQYYENRYGRHRLNELLQELIPCERRMSLAHEIVADLPCDKYYTTNFDLLLEGALRKTREVDCICTEQDARDRPNRAGRCQVRKLHGTMDHGHSLVVTRSDYAQFESLHPFLSDQLRMDLSTTPFLFVGYSLSDPNFNSLYDHSFFRLSPLHQHHFMTVTEASEHEIEDLHKRGIHCLRLEDWPGATTSDKLISFLSALREATSDGLHIGRFFRGLEPSHPVPIVIPSHVHPTEEYVYFPQMDLHVADSIEGALDLTGIESKTVADVETLHDPDNYLAQDIILVGSPRGNKLTEYVFDKSHDVLAGARPEIGTRFLPGPVRGLEDRRHGLSVRAADPGQCDGGAEQFEYALIARYNNPWARGKHIWVFAGIWGMGTEAIGAFLSDWQSYRRLPWDDDDVISVLEVSYLAQHDPFVYRSVEVRIFK